MQICPICRDLIRSFRLPHPAETRRILSSSSVFSEIPLCLSPVSVFPSRLATGGLALDARGASPLKAWKRGSLGSVNFPGESGSGRNSERIKTGLGENPRRILDILGKGVQSKGITPVFFPPESHQQCQTVNYSPMTRTLREDKAESRNNRTLGKKMRLSARELLKLRKHVYSSAYL